MCKVPLGREEPFFSPILGSSEYIVQEYTFIHKVYFFPPESVEDMNRIQDYGFTTHLESIHGSSMPLPSRSTDVLSNDDISQMNAKVL